MKSRQLINAITLAVMSSAATLAHAQPKDTDNESQRWHLMPQLQPLLAYLRCEEVPLNQFGEARVPTQELSLLAKRFVSGEPGREPSLIPLEVWPGTLAQLKVLAGYGFFAVLQFYPAADKDVLLKALAADGWEMKRVPSHATSTRHPAMALVPVHEGAKPMGKLVRRLTLTEAHIDAMTDEVTLDGLTMTCSYKAKEKK